ncbi:MAG: hypothetical protein IKL37_05830 [Alphaproteobacteria bacterium]|nr:hypothetical protein [Alphaproteobacteria bacterium]
MGFRRTFANIVCGFIPNRKARSRIRVVLNNPSIHSYVRFVKDWAKKNCGGVRKLSLEFGVGCHNLVVLLNDEHVFKFPLVNRPNPGPREMRITDALRSVSPIHFPEMEIIEWNGILVRRYEFIHGKLLCDFDASYINANREKLVQQLAQFMYTVGRADPAEIRDLKPSPDSVPGFMYGWFHNDIGQNFIMDDELNIVGFIDSEKAAFCDFRKSLYSASHFWDKNGYQSLMVDLIAAYSQLYYSNKI